MRLVMELELEWDDAIEWNGMSAGDFEGVAMELEWNGME